MSLIIPINKPNDYTLHIVIIIVSVLALSLYAMARQFEKQINTPIPPNCNFCHYQLSPDEYIADVIGGGKIYGGRP